MLLSNPGFVSVKSARLYLRGAPSPLVKLYGNPHAKLVNLRRAIYAKMGCTSAIREEWPEWDSTTNRVRWHRDEVEPSHEFDALFEKPASELVTMMFGDQRRRTDLPDLTDWEWENHLFAQEAVVFELYSVSNVDVGAVSRSHAQRTNGSDDNR